MMILYFQQFAAQKKDLELFPSLIFHMKLHYLQTILLQLLFSHMKQFLFFHLGSYMFQQLRLKELLSYNRIL